MILALVVWAHPACAETGHADSLATVAEAHFRSGQMTQATRDYTLLVQFLQEEDPEGLPLAEALFNLGVVYEQSDDLGAAALAFRRSLAQFGKLRSEDSLDSALALEGLAAVLLRQEIPGEADQYLERAMAVRQEVYPADHPQMARLYALRALASQVAGDWESTEKWYYQALMAYRRIHGNAHPYVAEIIQNIGTFYAETGYFQAPIMFRQAADVAEMLYGPWHPLRAVSLANYGWLEWLEGDYEASEAHLREALAIHDRLGARVTPDRGMCLFQLGRTLVASGRFQEAKTVLAEAAEIYEINWWRSGSGTERSLAIRSPYPLLAVARFRLDDPEGALQAFTSHQGRLAALAGRLRGLTFEMAVKRDSLVTDLDRCEQSLAQYQFRREEGAVPGADQGLASAQADLAAAEARWAAFQKELPLRNRNAERTPAVVAAELESGTAVIGWLDVEVESGQFTSLGFVLSRDATLAWTELPQPATGEKTSFALVEEALAEIAAGGGESLSVVAELRELRVDPLGDGLDGVENLIVIPSGAMAGFPAGLLVDDETRVTYAFNLDSLPGSGGDGTDPGNTRRVLAMADPVFRQDGKGSDGHPEMPPPDVLRSVLGGSREAIGQLPRLAGTRAEAEALVHLFPGTTALVGNEANETALRALAADDALAEFDIIHVATHALIDAEHPGRSALVLSQGNGRNNQDGLLTVSEISHTWNLDAELVTLSACASGLGRRIDGEGFVGFSHALVGVGARNILITLWEVDDQATALFMEKFYALLAEGGANTTPATALLEARNWLKDYRTPAGTRPFAAPRYWAGFILFSYESQ